MPIPRDIPRGDPNPVDTRMLTPPGNPYGGGFGSSGGTSGGGFGSSGGTSGGGDVSARGSSTGGSGGGGGFGSPDATSARIIRDQWQHFVDTYRPVEQDIINSAMNTDFTAQGDTAGATAGQSVAAAAGTAERNISRSGASLTAEERAAVSRRRDLASTKSVGGAENTTRRNLSDTRANLLAGIVGIGNGVSTTAAAGLQSAADMEAQRTATHLGQKTSTRNSNVSTAASAAMLLIAL